VSYGTKSLRKRAVVLFVALKSFYLPHALGARIRVAARPPPYSRGCGVPGDKLTLDLDQARPQGLRPLWGDVHVLQLDPFFAVEYYAFHAASLIVVLCWLYRHVRREIRRRDE
jgi:hypothetical protein